MTYPVDSALPFLELTRQFVDGKLTGLEFETEYLALSRSRKGRLPDDVVKPIHELFYDIDEYVADPELRARAGGLDDEQLLASAKTALRLLDAAIARHQDNRDPSPEDPHA